METFLKNIPSVKAKTKLPESEKQEAKNLISQMPKDTEKHFATENIRDKGNVDVKNELQATPASNIKHTTTEALRENTPIEKPSESQQKSLVSVQQGLYQLKMHEAQSPQPQGSSSTRISVIQTPLAEEIGKPAYLQGQPLQQSTQITNQMRQAPLAYQTGVKQQATSSFNQSIGQGLTGAKVVGMKGVSGNGCQSTTMYPNPSNFPMPFDPKNMPAQPPLHPSPAGPYQQSSYMLNSQMQSFQFHGPLQSYQGHQNQSIYPSYQPIYVTQNFYGNVPGPMTQHPGYFQAPQGPQTNFYWSGAGAVSEPPTNPFVRDQGTPIVQEGNVQQSPRLDIDLAKNTSASRKRQRRLKGLMEIVDSKTGWNTSYQIGTDLHNRANQLTQQNWSREMITEFVAHVTKSASEDSGSDSLENYKQQLANNEAEENQTSEATDENCPTLALYNRVRGVLNKLVPQKLDVLVNQVNALHIDSEEKLHGVVRLVFQKAIGEPKFVETYALMCKKLSKMRVSSPNSEAGENESNVTFGKLITTRCKMVLEKSIYKNTIAIETKEFETRADPEKKKLQEVLTEEERRFRTKSLCNIRFIGELIVQKMLKTTVIHKCINHLLKQIDDESLECLCELLSTAGEKSEHKRENLNPYFKQIIDIVDRNALAEISSRVRFMLLDLIELRKNKWIPRRSYSNTETVDQIQIEAETQYGDQLPTDAGACSKLVRNHQQYVFDTSKPENQLKFEFTFGDSYSSFSNLSCQLSMEKIHEELLSRMSNEKENSLDNICSWISANVNKRVSEPEFIKLLMTAILEVSIEPYNNTWKFRVDKFRNLQTLIHRYIDVNIKLSELQCLIAIQEYIHQLEQRQRLLLEILEKQIYQSILSSDLFHTSERNSDPTPLTRKSVAMMALLSFFTSLRKANDESRSHD